MLIVKKFGGTSVADKEKIFAAASKCAKDYRNGNNIVVVLSAMGKQTDLLITQAKEIHLDAPKREIDMLLTTGEQISVALMAMALDSIGVPAISLNAFQVGMFTTNVHGNARFKNIDTERIMQELDQRKIVVITGFQGINQNDDYTTLGRGGSDTTAVALAAVLHADKCEIYTDVDGIYTADPRIIPDAKKLDEITYDEMLELSTLGAGVLHNRSVEMAKKYGVQLVVRSSLNDSEGTVVGEEIRMEKLLINGVASDKNTARISLIGVEDKPGVAFKLFHYLAKSSINVDIILWSLEWDGKKNISFTVSKESLKESLQILNQQKDSNLKCEDIVVDESVAKVSIVGTGMISNPEVAAKMFEALYDAGINIKMISTSEIKITVLIHEKDTEKAVKAVHEKFIE